MVYYNTAVYYFNYRNLLTTSGGARARSLNLLIGLLIGSRM